MNSPTKAPPPPAEAQAQGGGELNMGMLVRDGTWVGTYAEWCRRNQIPPPSAPVGVELPPYRQPADPYTTAIPDEYARGWNDCRAAVASTLAQQPAAGVTHADHVRGLADMLAPEKQADTLRAAADAMPDQQPAAVDGAIISAATRLVRKAVQQSRTTSSVFTSDVDALAAALAAQPGGSENG